MLAAPTRSGKGVGVVIPNCLNYSDSLVVLDIKLENFDITSGYRAAHGQEVYLFCPFDENGRTHRYNPLEYISDDPAARIGDIDAIGTALYSGGNENDKFWSENAKDLFRGLCLLVLEHPTLPKTLGEILRQASGKGKPFKEHIQEMLEEAQNAGRPYSSACVDALNRITNNSENTLAGIVSTFNGPLLIFQNPRVDLATSANDFDLRDVRRKKMTIYLGVTPDKLKDAAVIVNLFFDQLLNLNTRVLPQQDPSLKYQCLLILDEFTAIGKVAMIQQSISYQAGYNMRVLTIIQNKSQLEDKYGKSGALTLMANHALMIMYAPSPVVQSDANEYSEMLGYQTVSTIDDPLAPTRTLLEGGTGSLSEQQAMPDFLPDRLEAGTHNMPGIAGLLAGVRFVRQLGPEAICAEERQLAALAAEGLRRIPGLRVYALPDLAAQTGVLSVVPEHLDAEALGNALAERGIAVRAGLHCAPLAHRTAGTLDTGTVRISFSHWNTREEVYRLLAAIGEICQ